MVSEIRLDNASIAALLDVSAGLRQRREQAGALHWYLLKTALQMFQALTTGPWPGDIKQALWR